jgi:hypothetical protein
MTARLPLTFTKLNDGWNAEPNAPEATVTVRDDTVVLEFYANPFAYSGFEEGDRLRLVFTGATRYRTGPTNDEGWWRGQCRFGRAAPAWGELYEVLGDPSVTGPRRSGVRAGFGAGRMMAGTPHAA